MNTHPTILNSARRRAGFSTVAAIGLLAVSLLSTTRADMPMAPMPAAGGDPALGQQIAQLLAKVAQLEASLAKHGAPPSAAPAGAAMPGMPAAAASATPSMAGMSLGAAQPTGAMNMMGMMDKMMPMDPAAPMPTGGMAMDKMGGGGMMSMMGMMDMDKMGMSGGGSMATMPQSALPGFPGASHLYHLGATGFFLDHPHHITLTTEQQAALNKAKEQALLAKNTADRAVEQAEQGLWALTAADQPDATKIEAKIREIEKLRSDKRLTFIRAVGDASKLLTDEQRKILTGFAPVASAAPAAAPMPVMKGM